jgi:hypothetical protein
MIDTRIRTETRTDPARPSRAGRPAGPSRRGRPGRRTGGRWWALLRAPALLNGPAGGPDDVTVIEDDRGRLAGPRGW